MDPNLFHLDWERTFEVLGLIIILAFVIERALAIIFENRIFIEHFERPGLKELIALGVSIAVCVTWKFDAISMFILTAHTTVPGYILTGAVIAGGSKASVKLFHDLLNVKSTAYEQRHEIQARKAADNAERAVNEASRNTSPTVIAKLERQADRNVEVATSAASASGSVSAAESAERAQKAHDQLEKIAKTRLKRDGAPGVVP